MQRARSARRRIAVVEDILRTPVVVGDSSPTVDSEEW